MKRLLILLLFVTTVYAKDNEYTGINKRNAFNLGKGILPPVTILLPPAQPAIKLYLTGIAKWRGQTNAYIYSADLPNKYLTLKLGQRAHGIKLLEVSKSEILIDNNGERQTLSFENNRLKSTVLSVKGSPTVVTKKDKSKDKNKSVKITPATNQPNIIKVPSRRPQIDPRIVQKGLEYIDKIEDKEKKEYILKRLERLQSGQDSIKTDVKNNEQRRQYDERRRDRQK